MGRAARTKRQRGQTRTWHTRNPWTGKPETFPVCISDEALREWEENRVRLAKAGYPDRPPEFDSPRHRAWNHIAPGRPLRPEDLDGAHATLGTDPTAKALGTWRTGDDTWGVKINVGRRDDGSFVHHVVVQFGQQEGSFVEDELGEELSRTMIEEISAVCVRIGLPPLHWISADEFVAEIAAAA